MELSKKQLDEIESWAMALYSAKEIAQIIDLDPDELTMEIEDQTSEAYRRYTKGRLISEGRIRKAVFELAENGSSPAQTLALKIIEESKIDERFE